MTKITLEQLLSLLPDAPPLQGAPAPHPAMFSPKASENFIQPALTLKAQSPLSRPAFVLISAPGAVGKSTLGQYIAHRKNWPFFDLSSLKIGANTFIGTIAKSYGNNKLSEILGDISKGRRGVVIDAFDEGEILSGWPQVESLIKDLWSHGASAGAPVFVLLARTESIQLVQLALAECASDSTPFNLYEIDFFDEDTSKEFVSQSVLSKSDAAKQHKQGLAELIEQIFSATYSTFSLNQETAWSNDKLRSFLGYAPVLQAIAAHLSSLSNFSEYGKSIVANADHKHTRIVSTIMWDLLIREQQKLVGPLKQRAEGENIPFTNWDVIYTPAEQIKRIILRSLGEIAASESPGISEHLPPELKGIYAEILSSFVIQHPFTSARNFSGPAFQDYCIAFALTHTDSSFKDLARRLFSRSTFVPTQLLIQFFVMPQIQGESERNLINGEDAGLIYESFAASDSLSGESSSMILRPYSEGDPTAHVLELYHRSSQKDQDELQHSLFIRKHTDKAEIEVKFSRSLRNAIVSVNGILFLGEPGFGFEIRDSQIYASEIQLCANAITAHSVQKGECSFIESREVYALDERIQITKFGPGQLRFNWPGSQSYPWSAYNYDSNDRNLTEDAATILHALRRILNWFRKDRRTDLARHQDLIHNVAVGESKLRNLVFKFLLEKGAVYKTTPLYFINLPKAIELGIHWGDLRNGKILELSNGEFIRSFSSWSQEQD